MYLLPEEGHALLEYILIVVLTLLVIILAFTLFAYAVNSRLMTIIETAKQIK